MKILIMVDMQNDFISGVLGNAQTQAVLAEVCRKIQSICTDKETALIYTMDTHTENYMDTIEGKNLPVPHCIYGTKGWELPDLLKEIVDSIPCAVMIKKETFGAYNLPEIVKNISENKKISEIELIGVCTDICVISNALLLKAFFPNIPITVDSNCCAGVSVESHNNALEAMKMCQINIL